MASAVQQATLVELLFTNDNFCLGLRAAKIFKVCKDITRYSTGLSKWKYWGRENAAVVIFL